MILSELKGCGEQHNLRHCRERASWPIAAPNRGPMRKEDSSFGDFKKDVNNPTRKARARVAWISETTWRLVDHIKSLRRKHNVEQ